MATKWGHSYPFVNANSDGTRVLCTICGVVVDEGQVARNHLNTNRHKSKLIKLSGEVKDV